MKVITILPLFAFHAVVVSGSSSLLRGNPSEQDNTDGGEKNRKVIPAYYDISIAIVSDDNI